MNPLHGRANVLVPQGNGYNVWFNLDNYDTNNPVKDIRMQITYNPQFGGTLIDARITSWDSGNNATTVVLPGVPTVSTAPDANGWVTSAYDFTLQPNPWSEKIEVRFSDTAMLDQVVIDTICTPEPTALALLVVGGLTALRRRRHA